MKKNISNYAYFISGILFAIASIIEFCSNKKLLGFTYICLAVTFIALGFSEKNKG